MTAPIKINYTNDDGNRTSTTISYAVACFYADKCHKEVLTKYANSKPKPEPLSNVLTRLVQSYVNQCSDCRNKHSIETMLLLESEIAIEKNLSDSYKQGDLFTRN